MENIFNKLIPPKCMFCNKVGEVFCENCLSTCEILEDQKCIVCDKNLKSGTTHKYCLNKHSPSRFISVFKYKDNVRECIKKSKYGAKYFMSLKVLTWEACSILKDWDYTFKDFIVVPIPLNKCRQRDRGFNQAEIIAKILSKSFNIPIDFSILTRIKDTKRQHTYNRYMRFKNISNCFKVRKDLKDKKILLVDDISTTGATFIEASKVLKENNAKDVWCFSLSKKILDRN